MSHFVDCVGWAASKMIFVFFYHFAADLRAFFLASHCTSASMLPHACAIFLTSASMLPVDHISMKGYSLAFWDDLYIPVS